MELAATRPTITPPVPPAVPLPSSLPASPVRSSVHLGASLPGLLGASDSATQPFVGDSSVAPSLSAPISDSNLPQVSAPMSTSVATAPLGPLPSGQLGDFVPPVQSVPLWSGQHFDVTRNIRMVPPFNEKEVEKYFNHFERVAGTLKWPVEVWTLLLQTVLTGKAQAIYSALTVQQSSDYTVVKTAILNAYELVPEAYRQRFRGLKKTDKLTYVEFAREKENALDRWCASQRTHTKEQLKELLLLEEFKDCVPEKVAMYLNDQKVTTLAQAAVCADEFVLTHKSSFHSPPSPRRQSSQPSSPKRNVRNQESDKSAPSKETRGCYYCHEVGHLIAECPVLKRKSASSKRDSKDSGFVRTVGQSFRDSGYEPFMLSGMVSLTGREEDYVPIKMLRDTGSAQSFVLSSVLPFGNETSCGSVFVCGIELGRLKVPLHTVHIKSELVSGVANVAVRPRLPVKGVALIVGNDLALDKVTLNSVPKRRPTNSVAIAQDVSVPCLATSDEACQVNVLSFQSPSVVISPGQLVCSTPPALSVSDGAEKFHVSLLRCDENENVPLPVKHHYSASGEGNATHWCYLVNISRDLTMLMLYLYALVIRNIVFFLWFQMFCYWLICCTTVLSALFICRLTGGVPDCWGNVRLSEVLSFYGSKFSVYLLEKGIKFIAVVLVWLAVNFLFPFLELYHPEGYISPALFLFIV